MNLNKSKITILIVVLLVLFFAIAMMFRVALPYDSIFTGGWVKFTSNDAYFHMRYVDSLVHNFPHVTPFDPYYIYPGGGTSGGGVHFFDWLLAIVIWIIGLGSPTQHLVDVVGAYFPAVLAALTVIPVFFIGKTLFNRWAGVLGACLVAIMPGEFMGRSILGFTDNHVAETLFSAVAAMFLILAIKAAGSRADGHAPMTFNNLIKGDRKVITMPLAYSALAGLFLGIYLDTWMGALLFVFIFSVYLVVQTIINHVRQKSSDHLGIIGFIAYLVAVIIFLPVSPSGNLSLAMIAALLIPPALAGISRLISSRKLNVIFYPASLIVAAAVVIAILYAISPGTVSTLWNNFLFVFLPGGGSTATTTMEMQPFLSPQGSFTTVVAWGSFTTNFFLIKILPIPGFGIISFFILLWLYIKRRGENENLSFFLIWSLIITIATLVQRRFAYYLVVNIAVLSAYISCQIIWLAGLRKLVPTQENVTVEMKVETPKAKTVETTKAKAKKKQPNGQGFTIYHVNAVLAIIAVFFTVFFFNIHQSKVVASSAPYAPSNGWEEALTWMKDNTPDPLGDPDAYYKLYGLDYKYPASAYGVTAWWDYGYWISRIAHRLPSTNPSQDPTPITRVANLFLSQNVTSSNQIMKDLGSSYVILDYDLIASKLWAVADWAKKDQSKYFSVYYVLQNGSYVPVQLMTPDFYRALAVRLYSFDGQAVVDGKPLVITYEEKVMNGNTYKILSKYQQYTSYKGAQDFISSQTSGKYDIAGGNPFVSPIPLDAVTNYKLVYSSKSSQSASQNTTIPDVKVFELVK
jgi:oligosaccharyl transferase (archaeosortase A-associated)